VHTSTINLIKNSSEGYQEEKRRLEEGTSRALSVGYKVILHKKTYFKDIKVI
jgi:hypothetical protein